MEKVIRRKCLNMLKERYASCFLKDTLKNMWNMGTLVGANRAGRKKVLVDINYDHRYVFGINIKPEKTVIALTNLRGDAKKLKEILTGREAERRSFFKVWRNIAEKYSVKPGYRENCMTILAPNHAVLCGMMFRNELLCQRLIACCSFYDERYDESKIVHTMLADKEDYIGPIALFVGEYMYGIS